MYQLQNGLQATFYYKTIQTFMLMIQSDMICFKRLFSSAFLLSYHNQKMVENTVKKKKAFFQTNTSIMPTLLFLPTSRNVAFYLLSYTSKYLQFIKFCKTLSFI